MVEGTTTAPSGRWTAFRVLAGIGATLLGAFTLVFTVLTFVDEGQEIHALHNVAALATTFPLFVVPLVAAIRDPRGSVVSFRMSVAAAVVIVIVGAVGGTIVTALITFVIVMLLLWLHPTRDQVLRFGALDVPLLALVAVAAIPAVVYGIDQTTLQADRPDGDPHKQFEHYAGMASGAIGLLAAGAVAAFDGAGSRLARWLVGLGGAALATAYLVYPEHVSAIDPAWAAAALVVSVVYIAVAEIDARRAGS